MIALYNTGTILIINDAPRDKDRLARWLAKRNYGWVFVNSYEEAIALMENQRFDSMVYAHEFLFDLTI